MASSRRGFLREAWSLTWPYWTSDEKWAARGLLAAVVALNLISVWINVRLNLWNRDFYNALQQYDWPQFWWQFAVFCMIAAAWITVAVYQLYLQQILHIRWRRWMTERFLKRWLSCSGLLPHPDRPVEHRQPRPAHRRRSRRFASITLGLSLGLLNSVGYAGIVPVYPVDPVGTADDPAMGRLAYRDPGYLVFAAFIYAVVGTLAHALDRPPAAPA